MVVGIPLSNLRKIKTSKSNNFSLDPSDVKAVLARDHAEGYIPAMIVPTLGTTSSTAIDPVRKVAEIAREYNVWVHVDAAYGGAYAVCPEYHYLMDGVELTDSIAINTHKKLLVNFDCCVLWVKDREPLLDALSLTPEYLRNAASESGGVIDYKDWQLPLGRRFRALKLWFVLRSFGKRGLQAHIRNGVELAKKFEVYVRGSDIFEMVTPRVMALVVFRVKGSNDLNQALLNDLNGRGKTFIIHTKLDGVMVLRLAVGGIDARADALEIAWEEISTRGKIVKENFKE